MPLEYSIEDIDLIRYRTGWRATWKPDFGFLIRRHPHTYQSTMARSALIMDFVATGFGDGNTSQEAVDNLARLTSHAGLELTAGQNLNAELMAAEIEATK
jgi:hypothetical protein